MRKYLNSLTAKHDRNYFWTNYSSLLAYKKKSLPIKNMYVLNFNILDRPPKKTIASLISVKWLVKWSYEPCKTAAMSELKQFGACLSQEKKMFTFCYCHCSHPINNKLQVCFAKCLHTFCKIGHHAIWVLDAQSPYFELEATVCGML